MSQHEKALNRLLLKPKDFEWSELVSLLEFFEFEILKGSGSGRKFFHKQKNIWIAVHEPHPRKIVKVCYLKEIIEKLKEGGFVK